MAINWRVRFLNPSFWASMIPAAILCVQTLAACFGIKIDLGDKTDTILAAVDSVFVVLALLGVSADFSTEGWSDSKRAMSYKEPYRDVNNDGVVNERDIDELLKMLKAKEERSN